MSIVDSSARLVGRVIRATLFEAVHRYHNALPSFVELYAGGPAKLGPVFAKDASLLFALTRLLMPASIAEIGVGLAASDIAFAEALRQNGHGHLYAVDQSDYSIARSRRLLGYHGLADKVTFLKGDSRESSTRDRLAAVARPADILFIDGDHSFEGARADFELYHELIGDDGIVVFHDSGPFPAHETKLLERIVEGTPEESLVPNRDGTGVYHRAGVAQAVDWIVEHHPEFARVSLHTLAEPCCGIVLLQKISPIYRPKLGA